MSKHPFRPLRRREVRWVWSAGVLSDVGTWVQLIVVGSLIARGTGSAVQTGLVALATFAPQGLASPFGGLLADRHDRRTVFIRALLMQASMTSVLAFLLAAGVRNSLALSGIVALGSAAGAVGAPSFQAMLPDLVPDDELLPMVSLSVYSWNAGRIIGPIIGAFMALTIGPAWTIAFNAATFAGLAAAVAMVRRPFLANGDGGGTMAERFREGARTLRDVPGTLHGVGLILLLNLALAPFIGLVPIYATAILHGDTVTAGRLSASQGVGAIAGGLVVAYASERFGRSRMLPVSLVLAIVGFLVYAWSPSQWISYLAIAVLGCGMASMFTTGMSVMQRDAPPHARGRITSIMNAGSGLCYGVGILHVGFIADSTSLRIAFTWASVFMLGLVAYLVRRSPQWRAAFDGAERAAFAHHHGEAAPEFAGA